MEEKTQYEFQTKIADSNKYNPQVLIKPENNRLLFDIINEAKQYQETKEKLNKELEIKENYKNILIKINKIIEVSLTNVGFNDDCYEYELSQSDIEKIYEMIPDDLESSSDK